MAITIDPAAGSIAGVTQPMGVGAAIADTDAIQRQQKITLGTTVATTSGTSIDFTSIPSWVKRITVMLNGVSTSGTSIKQIQIGSGAISTSGYLSTSTWVSGTTTYTSLTSGFAIQSNQATAVLSGAITLTLIGSNTWVASGITSDNMNALTTQTGGNSPALAGTLDRVRLTTVNGTDTFDAGSVNIMYE